MIVFRAGLYLAVVVAAIAVWAALGAGYAMETALLRGLLAFVPVVFCAYLVELAMLGGARPRAAATTPKGALDPHTDIDQDEPDAGPAAPTALVAAGRGTAIERREAA